MREGSAWPAVRSTVSTSWKPNPEYDLGCDALDAGKAKKAIAHFKKAARKQPERPRIYANHARALYALDRHDDAIKMAKRGRKLDGEDGYAALTLAYAYYHADRDKKALKLAREVTADEHEATRFEALVLEADALVALDREREALEPARLAIAMGRDDSSAHLTLARALAQLERIGEALVVAHLGLEIGEDEDLKETLEILEEAQEVLNSALEECETDDDDWELHHARATVLFRMGRLADAAESFDRARACHPDGADMADHSMLSHWEADCRLAILNAL